MNIVGPLTSADIVHIKAAVIPIGTVFTGRLPDSNQYYHDRLFLRLVGHIVCLNDFTLFKIADSNVPCVTIISPHISDYKPYYRSTLTVEAD